MFQENRLIYRGSRGGGSRGGGSATHGGFSAAAGRASVAAARASGVRYANQDPRKADEQGSQPPARQTMGQININPAAQAIADQMKGLDPKSPAYANLLIAYSNAMTPEEKSTLEAEAKKAIDPAIDYAVGYLNQRLAAQNLRYAQTLKEEQDQTALDVRKTGESSNIAVGDKLSKEWQYQADKGQLDSGESGAQRSYGDEVVAEGQRSIKDAQDAANIRNARAQSLYEFGVSEGNATNAYDIKKQEYQRTADTQNKLSDLIGVRAAGQSIRNSIGTTDTTDGSQFTPSTTPAPSTGYRRMPYGNRSSAAGVAANAPYASNPAYSRSF